MKFQEDALFHSRYKKMGNIACLEWLAGHACSAPDASCNCTQSPFISAESILFPCTLLQLNRYAIDRVWERSFENVVDKAIELWSELPRLRQDRAKLIPQCSSCAGLQHCLGGCIGRVPGKAKDFLEVEDRCHLRKAVYERSGL